MRLRYLKAHKKALYTTTSNERPVDGTSIRDTGTSRNESGTISITDDETRKRDGRIETTRPNEMGGLMNNLKMSAEEIVTKELIYN